MRILLVGDTHGDTGHVRRVLDAAARTGVERVFQLGDALGPRLVGHGHVHRRYTAVLTRPRAATRVEGLGADPSVAWDPRCYRAADSWLEVDTGGL
ncbi:hypothetical protein LO772_25605 [Yinghuangia sp. ASG 101]|uniref:hypothetical protein n=1 Tax=Yinghuangia sp. ASG 101 TaxID=2896848 RepID=UPI001E36F606|nr:hypothetical protein [Yinghuangia sp. ASG 101]UGQ10229.1 hypothetical protein LO772_25605 [Yinghuangia sp. ASG 101]